MLESFMGYYLLTAISFAITAYFRLYRPIKKELTTVPTNGLIFMFTFAIGMPFIVTPFLLDFKELKEALREEYKYG